MHLGLVLIRNGKTRKNGHHEKVSIFTDSWKQKARYAMLSHREKHPGRSGGRRNRRKAWAGAFIEISMGKDKAQ